MMKNLVTFISLALLGLAEGGTELDSLDINFSYLEDVGIPLAYQIYEAEHSATDDDNLYSRIINGSITNDEERPYSVGLLVRLSNKKVGVCGGSVLTSTATMTAAHCWKGRTIQGVEVTVVFGSKKLYRGGVRIKTKNVTLHEKWDPFKMNDDIAIIKHAEINFTNLIQPATLPTDAMAQNTFAGEKAMIAGFGRTASNDTGKITLAQVQRKVELTVMENKQCKKRYGGLRDTNICVTGPLHEAKSTCQGDSGNGLTIKINNTEYVIGIVSHGITTFCDKPNPIVKIFTRVTKYLDWIKDKLK